MALPSMRVGDVEVQGISDGILKTSLDLVIGMERAVADKLVGGTADGSLYIPVNNFLIRRGGKTIMIDAGAGNTMQPTLGKLPDNLRAAGVEPSAVTHIVMTHLHPDHANGLVDDAGNPHYPNAEIVVHRDRSGFLDAPARRQRSRPDQGQSRPHRDQPETLSRPHPARARRRGVSGFYAGAGARPYAGTYLLAARGVGGVGGFMAFGDVVHLSAIQISHPDAALAYDLDKDQAIQSRKRILDMAASERFAIAGAHVNAPGFGYVVRKGASFAFEPAGN